MEFQVEDLGRRSYGDAYQHQLAVHQAVLEGGPSTLLLVEHPPVITLGAGFHPENLVLTPEAYASRGIEVVTTDRGGDVTLHAPGQLVAYPIFRLEPLGKDLHRYLRLLEETAIQTCAHFGVVAERNPVNTGAWVGNRKVCAIGIKIRRWVSLHGLALNCTTDLSLFGTIVPCGIRGDFGVTSLTQEVGSTVPVEVVKPILVETLAQLATEAG